MRRVQLPRKLLIKCYIQTPVTNPNLSQTNLNLSASPRCLKLALLRKLRILNPKKKVLPCLQGLVLKFQWEPNHLALNLSGPACFHPRSSLSLAGWEIRPVRGMRAPVRRWKTLLQRALLDQASVPPVLVYSHDWDQS